MPAFCLKQGQIFVNATSSRGTVPHIYSNMSQDAYKVYTSIQVVYHLPPLNGDQYGGRASAHPNM